MDLSSCDTAVPGTIPERTGYGMDEPTNQDRDRSGTLYVVATPLGNLDDCAPRVRDTLAAASVIA